MIPNVETFSVSFMHILARWPGIRRLQSIWHTFANTGNKTI